MPTGRTRFTGENRKAMMRQINRSYSSVRPKTVHHVSQLPPARDNKGRIMFVGGATNAPYFSDGSTWSAL